MRIVLLGPPGSGKAELSKRIAAEYKIPVITQTSVVDTVAAENSELGRLAAEARDASRVSDELLLALLRIQLPKMDLDRGYVMVDMPKNSGQADVLDSVLNDLGKPVDLVLDLEVDTDDLMERLVGHIQCDQCGASYNMYVNPPMVDGVCDYCGARVSRRPDDYEETISNRLRVYETQMGPLLQYYNLAEKLQRVDATDPGEALWKKIKPIIDSTPSPEVEPAKVEGASVEETREKPAAKKKASKQKVATKKTEKKAAPQKKAAKKPTAKKAVAKKAASKKTSPKKAETPKAAAKKAVKKAAVKKATPKKVTKKAVKKKAVKKAAVKKATAKKVAAKKVAKKGIVKKVATKKSTKKAVAKKKVVKKAAAKKVAKKVTAKKTVAKKVAKKKVAKKTVAKKVAKKTVAKKAPAKKAVKQTPAKKKTAKKKVAKKKTAKRR